MYPYTIHLPDLKTEKITLGNKCRLKNFYRIGDGVYRSDQPSAACFRELEKFGMREILNLRCYHTDTKEAQGTSLILHHLPTRATLLRLDDLVTAMQIIRDRKGPLLFHCWHGSDRTGAVAAMYRMVFQHVPKQHAIDEMVEGIFGFHMIFDNIIDTIDDRKTKKRNAELDAEREARNAKWEAERQQLERERAIREVEYHEARMKGLESK